MSDWQFTLLELGAALLAHLAELMLLVILSIPIALFIYVRKRSRDLDD